ncbi:MAG: serine/threonine protein kinase, partial [Planctomycetaceae bacterium]|nr:serine/threonine protein kinase [Planctomycetaceae bacterium]
MNQVSDRNLLFGILALQMEFITQAGLIAAMQAWTLQKSRPLGELLVELGLISAEDRAALEPMVDRHVARHGGSAEQSLAALSSVSDVAEELRLLADDELQQTMSYLRWRHSSGPSDSAAQSAEASPPTQQRFELLRAHAEGGLGKVWIAKDRELNREVAFKEIKPGHAQDSGSRGRFILEAEITGGLEHPGIVPIYSLGHHDNGRPFYAMRFIRGGSLKEAIQQFHATATKISQPFDPNTPTVIGAEPVAEAAEVVPAQPSHASREAFASVEFRQLLGRFIDVCNAIEYAHSRGVLHRDLKPGNIMLGKYGETLVVDWGLAKATGKADQFTDAEEAPLSPSSGSGFEPTQIGSVIGTLAYMSPEQAAGRLDELGPVTDVYSLGATLYHVLTGQPPISNQSPRLTIPELLQRVLRGDFPPPREINPQLPKPLEAICLKAMSLRPSDRYASTAALAADVECYLADEPVSAHAEPLTIRARRWVKRHQTLVGSTAAAVLVATVTLSVLVVLVTGKNQQLVNAKSAVETKRAEAEASAEVAREQSQLALSTLNTVIFDVQRSLKNVPGGATIRNRLLASVLPQLDKVSTQFAAQSVIDRNTMVALNEMAGTILQLGNTGSTDSPHVSNGEAESGSPRPSTLGRGIGSEGQSAVLTAERLYRRAYEIAQQLAADNPNDLEAQRDLSLSFKNLGDVFLKLGRADDALTQFQDGLKISRVLAEADPNDTQKQRGLAVSFERLGQVSLSLGKTDDALKYFSDELVIAERRMKVDPSDVDAQRFTSVVYIFLGDVFLALGRTADALTQFQDGLKISRVLAEADPNDTQK